MLLCSVDSRYLQSAKVSVYLIAEYIQSVAVECLIPVDTGTHEFLADLDHRISRVSRVKKDFFSVFSTFLFCCFVLIRFYCLMVLSQMITCCISIPCFFFPIFSYHHFCDGLKIK